MSTGFELQILYPIRVVNGQNVIVVDSATYTIPAGDYYLIQSNTEGFPSLFEAIDTAITAETFTFSLVQPTGYPAKETVEISVSSSVTLNFSDAAFTFPPEYLGFPSDQTDLTGSGFKGSRSALGVWFPGTVDSSGGGEWSSIRSHVEKEIYASTDPIYADTKIIRMRDDRVVRGFSFENVPGVRVQGGSIRGADSQYRATARIPAITDGFTDDGEALGLRAMYRRVNGGQKFLVLYVPGDSLVAGEWEALRLYSAGAHASFDSWYTMTRPGGEFYDVNFLGLVTDGEYDY